MSEPEYEYHGLLAQTWDLFRGDTSDWDDRHFYLGIVREFGEPVLDVGCGTGRILLDFMALGINIDGVDNSPEMLALCRQKAASLGLNPSIFQGEMQTMQLPRQYQTILVPSSSFQLVIDPVDARSAIKNLFTHLLPGGRLVMPFMRIRSKDEPLELDWHQSGEKPRPEQGVIIKRWSYSRFDPDTQLEHTADRYEVIKDGSVVATESHSRSPATRDYTLQQALDLYRTAGFVDICAYQGFTRKQASQDDQVFTLAGMKPG